MQASLIKTLDRYIQFLEDNDKSSLHDYMSSTYRGNTTALEDDFDKTAINSDSTVTARIEKILSKLSILPRQRSRYIYSSITVYDFFEELAEHNKKANREAFFKLDSAVFNA